MSSQAKATDEQVQACQTALIAARQILEQARCHEAEFEALQVWAGSLLQYQQIPDDADGQTALEALPGGVQDAWVRLNARQTAPLVQEDATESNNHTRGQHGGGQYGKICHTQTLASTLQQLAELGRTIQTERVTQGPALQQHVTVAKAVPDPNVWLHVMDQQLATTLHYHAQHDANLLAKVAGGDSTTNKRPRLGHPAADGYDLNSTLQFLDSLDGMFTADEVMGKYLDLQGCHNFVLQHSLGAELFGTPKAGHDSTLSEPDYIDFLKNLQNRSLPDRPESIKLQHRKYYAKLLSMLEEYLRNYIAKTSPLINILDVTAPALQAFEMAWKTKGGYRGWHAIPAEASMVQVAATETNGNKAKNSIDLTQYNTVDELQAQVDADTLKVELARLGLKCGGTAADRAARLWKTKGVPREQWPIKIMAATSSSSPAAPVGSTSSHMVMPPTTSGRRRVDIARHEVLVQALLDQVRDVLERTIVRMERRATRTQLERDKELHEELYGGDADGIGKKDGDDDGDDEDNVIYNPKNVPLDWDGKPIPYWLFKLHGLNHYYECEICGGEAYRGRRQFELHFNDQKHALGMKALGIPNTNHFHGVTKIADAQQLWATLQGKLGVAVSSSGANAEEEYEDSHGNVLSRTTYEDLARQGML